jgi:hypothetical protein
MFTEELQKRTELDYKKTLRSFKNKYNNDKSEAKKMECRRLLNIHDSPSATLLQRILATTILLNDRLDLDKIKDPAPWDGSTQMQKQWLHQWRQEVESAAAAKFGGDLNKAVDAVLTPLAAKNGQILSD